MPLRFPRLWGGLWLILVTSSERADHAATKPAQFQTLRIQLGAGFPYQVTALRPRHLPPPSPDRPWQNGRMPWNDGPQGFLQDMQQSG